MGLSEEIDYDRNMLYKNVVKRSVYRDGSVSRVLAIQAQGP